MSSNALDVLNSIPLISNSDYDYNLLSSILIDLKLNNKTYWEMDSTQFADISYLASICPDNEASISAKCILNLVNLDSIKMCNGMNFNRPINAFKVNNNMKNSIQAYPNPFENSNTIEISKIDNLNYRLVVRDLTMRILKEISIENDDEVTLTNEVFNNQGIYICSLENLTSGEISTMKLIYNKQ